MSGTSERRSAPFEHAATNAHITPTTRERDLKVVALSRIVVLADQESKGVKESPGPCSEADPVFWVQWSPYR